MRKILCLFVLLTASALYAQVGNPSIIVVASAPSGACSGNLPDQQVIMLGTIYTCQSGTWAQVGGGAGGAVTSVFGRTGAVVADAGDYSTFYLSLDGGTLTDALNINTTFAGNKNMFAATNTNGAAVNGFDIQSNGDNIVLYTQNQYSGGYRPYATIASSVSAPANLGPYMQFYSLLVSCAGGYPNAACTGGTLSTTGSHELKIAGSTDGSTATTLDLVGTLNASLGVKTPNVLPNVLYSAAGTALPTCAVGIKGEQATVSDATAPTYMGAYTSGGAITVAVICSYDGTAYNWLTH